MKRAFLLSTLTLFVLGFAACNEGNDITGVNAGKLTPTADREAQEEVAALKERPHKVAVIAPGQPAPIPYQNRRTPAPTPTRKP